jgi:outer membrane receptor protein involved in Fe transport
VASLLAATTLTSPAFAQTAEATAADAETIVITGSRIARPELEGSVPVNVITSQAITQSGAANIQDVLADLPATGQAISRTTTNFSTTGNGVASVNLRNLGSSRTLVLVNGRRFVAGVPGTSIVDLNTIPTDLIKQVEVVTGGASAVYGSEAIAGVVNFVMDDRLEGIQARLQGTLSDKGDASRQYFSVGAGKTFADGRAHVQVYGQYDNDEGLRSNLRPFSERDIPNRSSFASQGLFDANTGSFAGAGAGNGALTPTTNVFTFGTGNVLKRYENANTDGYNRNNDRYLAVPVKRYLGAASGFYEVSDALTFYAEGQYARTESRSRLEPQAVAWNDLPNFDGIPITNPFMPQQIRDRAVALGNDTVFFRRRSNDIFDRSNEAERTTWRLVGGVRGEFAENFRYDVYYTHGETKDYTASGTILGPNYANALNAVAGTNGPVCSINVDADPTNNDPNCVPINIFGLNTVSSAAAAYVTNNGQLSTYDAKVLQDVVSGSISGEVFELPGGPVAFAVGAEYRKERSTEDFDEATNLGLTLGNQLSDTRGSFDTKEVFAEVVVPVISGVPFAEYLGFEAAARYADYSTVGGVWSWKIGGEYAPVRDIRFRAVYSEATRAPNISELFSAQSETFPAVTDPCDQREGEGDGAPITKTTLSAACLAVPAIAAAAATPGGFVYTTADIQTINGFVGGNPDLNEETSKTLTLGAVFQPSFLEGFSGSVDYYSIKVENAIGIIGQQTSLDECYEGNGEAIFCDNVIRGGNGLITTINALNLNTGSFEVEGIDVQARYRRAFGESTMFDINVLWNHRLKQEQTSFPGGPTQNELGQLDCYSCGRLGTGFKDRVNVSTTLSFANLSINWRVNYMGPVVDNLESSAPIRVGAYTYHDLQFRFDLDDQKRFGFYAGIDNVGDKKPPVFNDTNAITFPGTQTAAGTYDLFGRMLYVGAQFKF